MHTSNDLAVEVVDVAIVDVAAIADVVALVVVPGEPVLMACSKV